MTGLLLFLCPKSGRKEITCLPCPHCRITIVKRNRNESTVAAAAYQSGEKLFSEYDQEQKYYPYKTEITHKEILLPPMRHRSMQTAIPCGTLLKRLKNNGTLSLPGGSCLPSRGKSLRNSTPISFVTTAGSFFQGHDC